MSDTIDWYVLRPQVQKLPSGGGVSPLKKVSGWKPWDSQCDVSCFDFCGLAVPQVLPSPNLVNF